MSGWLELTSGRELSALSLADLAADVCSSVHDYDSAQQLAADCQLTSDTLCSTQSFCLHRTHNTPEFMSTGSIHQHLPYCNNKKTCNTDMTHTRLTALCPGLPGSAGTRKVKPIWILLKQETVSGSGISWAICKSAPRSRQITMPAPPPLNFYRPDALPAAQPTASKHLKQIGTCQCVVNASLTMHPGGISATMSLND